MSPRPSIRLHSTSRGIARQITTYRGPIHHPAPEKPWIAPRCNDNTLRFHKAPTLLRNLILHNQHRTQSTMAPSPPPTRSKSPSTPRPSASVVLVSPRNEILLLHRVRSSNSFPSAHVFPGGNLDAFHDGDIPAPDHPTRHQDGPAYRMAAIREAFEESGILLARNNGFGRLVEVENGERDEGRKRVHRGEVRFEKWLAGKGGRADVGEFAGPPAEGSSKH